MGRNLLPAVRKINALARRRTLRKREPGPPLSCRPDGTWHESTAAIWADVEQQVLNTIRAKGALVAANPRERRRCGKIPVAAFAVGSEFQCHRDFHNMFVDDLGEP